MTLVVTHSTVATLPDEAGAEVNKAEWNANHVIVGSIDLTADVTGVLPRRKANASPPRTQEANR